MELRMTLRGTSYPCHITMGAYRRYKRITGREAAALDDSDTDGTITFAYCCVAAACNADNVPFDIDLDTFADCITPDALARFYLELNADVQKKTVTQSGPPQA